MAAQSASDTAGALPSLPPDGVVCGDGADGDDADVDEPESAPVPSGTAATAVVGKAPVEDEGL